MATPVVYRVPRRFITFPEDPPPYGFLAVSFLAHMACFGAAVALSAFISSQADQSKVYIVNLVPSVPALGGSEPAPPVAKAPVTARPAPPAPAPTPKAEEKAPPKAARPEPAPPRPARAPERTVAPPPPRTVEVSAPRPRTLDPSELALPKRPEKESPALPSPASKAVERTLLPPPPVTAPAAMPTVPAAPRLPEPPRIATPPATPTAPAAPAAPPTVAMARPTTEPARPGRPNAPAVSGSNVSVDASDFPFTYYLRQVHAKVAERWRRPPVIASEQTPTVIYFEIDRQGQIRGEPKIKQTSGDEIYDQSALRAVLESVPFPPLPSEFAGYLKVNFGFDPALKG